MEQTRIHTMQDYCKAIRKYFELYDQNNPSNIQQEGNAKQQLSEIMNENESTPNMFYIKLAELVGEITRALAMQYSDVSFLSWIGGENETFTKERFVTTMKSVWPDL